MIRFPGNKVSRLPGRPFAPWNSANSVFSFPLKGLWKSFFFPRGRGKPDFKGLRCHGSNVARGETKWWERMERKGWSVELTGSFWGGGGLCFASLWIIVLPDRLSICTCRVNFFCFRTEVSRDYAKQIRKDKFSIINNLSPNRYSFLFYSKSLDWIRYERLNVDYYWMVCCWET